MPLMAKDRGKVSF